MTLYVSDQKTGALAFLISCEGEKKHEKLKTIIICLFRRVCANVEEEAHGIRESILGASVIWSRGGASRMLWNKEGCKPTHNSTPSACLKHVSHHTECKDLQMSVYHQIQQDLKTLTFFKCQLTNYQCLCIAYILA